MNWSEKERKIGRRLVRASSELFCKQTNVHTHLGVILLLYKGVNLL